MPSIEQEVPKSELCLKPGESFRPFEGFPPMKPDQFSFSRDFILEGVGMGSVSITQIDENDLYEFQKFVRKKEGEIVTPYGPIAVYYYIEPGKFGDIHSITPGELMLSFKLPVAKCLPNCVFELPSVNQSFIGVPWVGTEEDEEIQLYYWKKKKEDKGEIIALLPNESRVFNEITLHFQV